jgi:hydrophobe/amphiphile efflux-3 (HAE3) family protein
MQRFWSRLAVELGKRAGLVAVVGLLLTVGLGLGITRLEFATGQDSYLNKDEQVYKDSVQYQDLFGGQAMLGMITMDEGHTVDELFDEDSQRQFQELYDDLTEDDLYQGVVTPLMVLQYSDELVQGGTPGGDPLQGVAGQTLSEALSKEEPGTPEATARATDSGKTLERINAIPPDERVLTNREWVKFLIYDNEGRARVSSDAFLIDERHAQILVRLKGNESIDEEGSAATIARERILELDLPNASVVSTGAPMLLKDINDYLKGGMLLLGGIAVAIMVVILLVLFDVRWRLLPLAVILIAVVWAFGLAGYLGIPLTIVTIAGLPVMLGVGIDYAIQMHARVEEEAVLDRAEHPIQETARGLGPALLVVTFDAIFAFIALRFAKVPMIRDFGLLLAVGIAVICLASIVLPLAVLGIREFRSPTQKRDFSEGRLGKLTVWLGSLPQKTAVPLAVASIVIFFGGAVVEDKLVLQTDPVQWVNQSSGTIKDIRAVEHEVNSSAELGVYVTGDDVFSDEFVSFLHEFRRSQLDSYGLDGSGQLITGGSIESVLGGLLEIPGASDLAPTGTQVKAAYDLAPPDLQAILVSPDETAANLVFRVAPGTLEDRAVIIDEIRSSVDPPDGVRATPSGLAAVGVGLLHNLEANRVLLTYLAMLFVFLFLAVRLRSIIRSVLSLVPVAIAVGTASLVAYALDLKLSPMTAVGGPLVVAACTEFTSLILLRFVEERGRGLEPQEAIDVAAARTGRAFIVSGLTAVAGVAVLSFSSLPLLRDFGRIVAMNVTVALLSALVVLPPLLVWAERRGWVTRGLLKETEPFVDTPRPAPAPAVRPEPA